MFLYKLTARPVSVMMMLDDRTEEVNMETVTLDKRFEKGDRMREIILSASIKLISERGIEGLSAAKIATVCGISKSNVFHHFKTIDAILLAVNDLVLQMSLDAINISAPNLDAFLKALLTSMLNIGEEERKVYNSFFAFYNRGLFDPKLSQSLLRAITQLQDSLANQLFHFTLKTAGLDVAITDIDQAPDYLKPYLKPIEFACRTCAMSLFAFMDGLALQILLTSSSGEDLPNKALISAAIDQQIYSIEQQLKHPLP